MYKNILIIGLILVIIFFMKECHDTKTISNQYKVNLTLQEHKFSTIIDKQGNKLSIQQQEIVSKQSDINRLIDKVDELSKITTQIKIETRTKIDSIMVLIDNPVYITRSNGKYLMLPANFRKLDNPWYGFTGTILDNGTERIDSLWINNKPTITFGMESFKLKEFIKHPSKRRVPEVVFEDKNPYTTTQKLSNVKLDKPLPKISIGIQGGYGITSKGLGGYLGLGINYSLISF